MRVMSLFSGAGGLDEGFRQAGFKIGFACDIADAAVRTHNFNHPGSHAIRLDLSVATTEEIMLEWMARNGHTLPCGIIGGPPCQAFSVSNVHQKKDDPRRLLPGHYARIIREINGQWGLDFFVFENVPGLASNKHYASYHNFKHSCEEAGFRIFEKVLDAQYFGVAQVRPRIFVVGINRDKFPYLKEFTFPTGTSPTITVRDKIYGLPEPVFYRKDLSQDDIPFHPNHWCMNPKSEKFKNGVMKPGTAVGRCFRVLSWDKPSWTVAYGNREVHVHPNGRRRLSILEAMLLQGFDMHYRLLGNMSEQITLVSDAVPPPVARELATAIVSQLGYSITDEANTEAAS